MGNLLRVLHSRDESPSRLDIFVDFENCIPTNSELEVWNRVDAVLQFAQDILIEMQHYRGATDRIRHAIINPHDEAAQRDSWETVLPLVSQLKRYFEFSIALERIVPELLGSLCNNEMTARQHLETQQSLFKQFAEILDFTLTFDDLKMTNPSIQNDFSYYRRSLNRMRLANDSMEDFDEELEVTNEIANRMSLFYAHSTPMLKVLGDTTSRFVSENKHLPVENTTECLSTMANICRIMIENPKYRNKIANTDTLLFCLRVMVGVIILYDHVHPIGAFSKSSNIDLKSSIRVLKERYPGNVEALLNALRYKSVHINSTYLKSARSISIHRCFAW